MTTSASYAGLADWNKAVEDAKECIRLSPEFVKGYYRLATAQLELKEYDMAQATIKQGLAIDANNTPLLKLMGMIKKAKKVAGQASTSAANSAAATIGGNSKLDQATSRELYDLEVQHKHTIREYQQVQVNLNRFQKEQRMSDATLGELDANPAVGAYYRSVGKIFMKSTREKVMDHLKSNKEESVKKETGLTQKFDYLERRLKSQKQNMRELVSQSS
jgi:chaperonin cofactor prefoldin